MFEYKHLKALASVVDEGGFDRAAKVLCLTQSAVSQRIRQLEERTGQILLSRTTPPIPTETGRELLRHYRQVRLLEDDLAEMLDPEGTREPVTLVVGVNTDSLETWFMEAVGAFLSQSGLLLDLRVDDQEQTQRLLKNGEVTGCVSTAQSPMQGCRMEYLGCMDYRLLATPAFAARWFPEGLTVAAVSRAPAVIFNRKDNLHHQLLHQVLGDASMALHAHYVPSHEQFAKVIITGSGYGMLPDQQSRDLLRQGTLANLVPDEVVSVKLFWHCWNLESRMLGRFTEELVQGARRMLGEG